MLATLFLMYNTDGAAVGEKIAAGRESGDVAATQKYTK